MENDGPFIDDWWLESSRTHTKSIQKLWPPIWLNEEHPFFSLGNVSKYFLDILGASLKRVPFYMVITQIRWDILPSWSYGHPLSTTGTAPSLDVWVSVMHLLTKKHGLILCPGTKIPPGNTTLYNGTEPWILVLCSIASMLFIYPNTGRPSTPKYTFKNFYECLWYVVHIYIIFYVFYLSIYYTDLYNFIYNLI